MTKKTQIQPTNAISQDSLPPALNQAISALYNGQLKNVTLKMTSTSITLTADSSDGVGRFILSTENYSGISEETKIKVAAPTSKAERLDRVEKLHKEGYTQNQITQYTLTSQKTVSNDIKELKQLGRIK